ncbi:peptidoglycan-recognition protein LC-like [Eupeodes corollae]|uniref:peptidoglycan-recognition protein LC-like n=1 Tax=Eupeodes corollae TaxID=290404 RepID=UPI002490001E|nr:peptidoglycan-recognition protein LC-like [Eupeodes corollae]
MTNKIYVNEINIPHQSDSTSNSPKNLHKMSKNENLCATINIENIIQINPNGTIQTTTKLNESKSPPPPPPPTPSLPASPNPSLRSTSISISSIESDALSSIIDSDVDEFEDTKTGCMLKKLGTQTTLPPPPPPQSSSPDKHSTFPNVNSEFGVLISQQIERDIGNSPNGPQIASLSIDNSTDVTFGSKRYLRGPVTIQQILVEKPKTGQNQGKSNPAFEGSNGCSIKNNNTQESSSDGCDTLRGNNNSPLTFPKKFLNKKAVILTALIVVLTIIIGIIILSATFIFRSKVLESDIQEYSNMISRDEWVAQPPNVPLVNLETPVSRVIISHTSTQNCSTKAMCIFRTRFIQTFNMESRSFDDIRYNFLVGGDGNVYVGRGWDKVGAHTKGYNDHSLGIALIGTFNKWTPPVEQLNATKWLLDKGVRLNKLDPDYKVYGSRQLDFSDSPGEALYKLIQKWPHWSNDV